MTLGDLLFLLGTLTLIGAAIRLAILAAGRRFAAVTRLARRMAIGIALYATALVGTSLSTAARRVPIGEAQCFDDWCITVTGTSRREGPPGDTLFVDLRLASLARGIAQGESDVYVYVRDGNGREYLPVTASGELNLHTRITPNGSLTAQRGFLVPRDAPAPALLVGHGPFPHCCIIGDRESILHKRTIVPLR